MKKLFALVLTLLALSASQTVLARQSPLDIPARVALTAPKGDIAQTRNAIVKGSAMLGWTVVADEPGKLTLKYSKNGKHEAVIDALYDAGGYQFAYVSSVNLNYEKTEQGERIHPNFNRWLVNLIKYIGIASANAPAGAPQPAPAQE
ncbi:hypothetical protein [Paludibacterium paludis]|uniref:Uncharacterized protein n=1 Tax=Paludibacterium paludis TaxID=1225769 RepID=A0A918U7F1_9NEIS|nr:hypothetical protein [Paludibacterium paludis]GGY05297.1 hypothetical protein GCM10011289_04850 [Paludibacterium paludis]